MIQVIDEKWQWIEATHGMRMQLLDLLGAADLAFTPGGQNMTLGALCREMGEVEHSYIQSLKTFTQDWSYRNGDPAVASSVAALKVWCAALDDEMKDAVAALGDEDAHKPVARGDFTSTVAYQLDFYLQALLIFLGKATIFLRALNKPLPQPFVDYIG